MYSKDVDLSDIQGVGYDVATDSLVKIRDELTEIEGAGFNPATDTLENVYNYQVQLMGSGFSSATDSLAVLEPKIMAIPTVNITQAEVNTQVDLALNTAIPGSPVANSINEHIKIAGKKVLYEISTYGLSDDILFDENDGEKSDNNAAYEKKKEMVCCIAETLRIKFDMRSDVAGNNVYGKIYKNGVACGIEQANMTEAYVTYSEDLVFDVDDTIELWCYKGIANNVFIKNFRICGKFRIYFENTLT